MSELVVERPECMTADEPLAALGESEPSPAGLPSQKRPKGSKALGAKGEEAAASFLYRRGYEILERNWHCFAGEADIIAKDNDTIVFVEVKTRKDCKHGFPSEAVTQEKRSRYEKIALAYLSDYDQTDFPVRFDVVAIVVMGPGKAMVRHHINAFSVA